MPVTPVRQMCVVCTFWGCDFGHLGVVTGEVLGQVYTNLVLGTKVGDLHPSDARHPVRPSNVRRVHILGL